MVRRIVVGLLCSAAMAAPASAAEIVYAIGGQTSSGVPFFLAGKGDTNDAILLPGLNVVLLSDTRISLGLQSGTISDAVYYYNNYFGSVGGFGTFKPFQLPSDFLRFFNPAFAAYDGISDIGPVPVLGFYAMPFNTSLGSVNLEGAQNLQFLAAVNISAPPGISAAPEPATWAMMLVGFGAIGYAMRRRPRVTYRIGTAA